MSRETAPVTALLALCLVGAYGLELASGGDATCAAYGLVPARPSFEGALGSLFLHDPSSPYHLGGNLVFLVIFGGIVERALGSVRFLGLYLAAGFAGAAMHILVDPSATDPLVGCSGALFGLLAVAAVIRPRLAVFVVLFVGTNVWHAFTGGAGNVSFGCHLGGFFAGFLVVVFLWMIRSEVLEAT